MIKIILSGCNGRMGRVITDICQKNTDTEIVAGVDINTEALFGYPVYDSIAAVNEDADVIIDFSHPSLLEGILEYSISKNVPAVISTTGHSEEQILKIQEASKKVALFRSGNMSLGINVLQMLVERAAKILGDTFDAEIIERHHNQKLDAPSGTALMLAERLSDALPYQTEYVYDRHSVRQKRGRNEVGIHTLRGGTIVGEHEVIFAGRDEVIEIKHTAQSREVFAAGAVKAAVYIAGITEPGLYNMDNLLANYIEN